MERTSFDFDRRSSLDALRRSVFLGLAMGLKLPPQGLADVRRSELAPVAAQVGVLKLGVGVHVLGLGVGHEEDVEGDLDLAQELEGWSSKGSSER